MDLLDALNLAVAYTDSPPPNEAATCLWVVYPLLQAMGYVPSEIHPQGSDSNGQYPDYTILPSKPECWYVEAKAWNVRLADTHAQQALNYANTGGKRWVVLTNGHIWRLYDNHIHGVAADKFVAEISLRDGNEAVQLFEALRKPSYLSGELDTYARRARLSRTLGQLKDENSSALKALWAAFRKEPGLSTLTRSELAAFFAPPAPATAPNSPQSPRASSTAPSHPAPPTPAVRTTPIVSVADARSATNNASVSARDQAWVEFWNAFHDQLAGTPGHRFGRLKAGAQNWSNYQVDPRGFYMGGVGGMRDSWIGVNLWIDSNRPKEHLAELQAQRDAIESELLVQPDESMLWLDKPKSRSCEIQLRKPCDLKDRGAWNEAVAWMVNRLLAFDRTFRARIRELP